MATVMSPFAAAADLFDPPPRPHQNDPVGWLGGRLGETTWQAQRDIARSVVDHRKTAVRSAHGVGKSFVASRIIAWWIDSHPPGTAFVVSTAPTGHQVRGILWREIGKAHKRSIVRGTPIPGRILGNAEWKIGQELVGWGRKPSDTDESGFQGIHARFVLVVLDEACGVPEQLWTAVEAVTTNSDARILAIGNPDDPTGQFAKVCSPGSGWNVIHIDGMTSPNIGIDTLTHAAVDELDPCLSQRQLDGLLVEAREAGCPERAPGGGPLAPYLLEPFWICDKVRTFGVGTPAWQSKVRGIFPESRVDTLIPLQWIEDAMGRDLAPRLDTERNITVDVARFGQDETVMALREDRRLRILSADARPQRTTVTAGRATAACQEHKADEVRVDGAGVGGGVVDDMVADALVPVVEMQAGSAAQDPARFGNARAEWYWQLRVAFETGDIDIDDLELAGQLQAMRYRFDRRGKIWIEGKDDMRKRGLESPDRADTAMMAFAVLPPLDDLAVEDWSNDISPY